MNLTIKRLLWKLRRGWYQARYGYTYGLFGTMLPEVGKGKFVSVYQKGKYLEIKNERTGEMIRLIPYQPNHGVMVEKHDKDGKTTWRNHCDFTVFDAMGIGVTEKKK